MSVLDRTAASTESVEPRESSGSSRRSPLHRLLWVPSAPVNLAVLRVVVFAMLAFQALTSHAVAFSRLSDRLVDAPPQLGSLLVALPREPAVVSAALWLVIAACVAAIVGWRTRGATLLASVLALYVLGIPQLYGKVNHYHHLVWLAVLLACSPCADALAIDARNKPRRAPSVRYGFPLRIAWLLIGFCYFFPGLAKLGEWKIWLAPGNLRGLLWLQQWSAGAGVGVPGWTLTFAAAATLVFELSFVFLVLNRRLRPWAVAAGVAFHLATFATMRIGFWSLWVCYVAFIDWSRPPRDRAVDHEEPTTRTQLAATALIIGAGVAGVTLLISAWPFAAYPTFAGNFNGLDRAATTHVVAIVDGKPRPAPVLEWVPASRRAAVIANAMQHPEVLAALGRDAVPNAEIIQVWRVIESTQPARRGEHLSRKLLLEVDVGT